MTITIAPPHTMSFRELRFGSSSMIGMVAGVAGFGASILCGCPKSAGVIFGGGGGAAGCGGGVGGWNSRFNSGGVNGFGAGGAPPVSFRDLKSDSMVRIVISGGGGGGGFGRSYCGWVGAEANGCGGVGAEVNDCGIGLGVVWGLPVGGPPAGGGKVAGFGSGKFC